MPILPSKGAWRRWDWPTRFGVVTGVSSFVISLALTMLWLFGVDVPEIARREVQAMFSSEVDPWAQADPARVEARQERYLEMGRQIVEDLQQADLRPALNYHSEYADRRCYDDEQYKALMRVRFAIAQFLYHDPKNRFANEAYNEFPEWSEALRLDRAEKFLGLYRYLNSGGAEVSIRSDLDLKLFARTLLDYHKKIVETKDWEEKFAALDEDHMGGKVWRKGLHQPYATVGFPPSADYCMNSYSFAFSLDTYLYSFWWRRWREELMPAAKLVLKAFLNMRVFPAPAPRDAG